MNSKTIKWIKIGVLIAIGIALVWWFWENWQSLLGWAGIGYGGYEAGVEAHTKAVDKILAESKADKKETAELIVRVKNAKGVSLIALSRSAFGSKN